MVLAPTMRLDNNSQYFWEAVHNHHALPEFPTQTPNISLTNPLGFWHGTKRLQSSFDSSRVWAQTQHAVPHLVLSTQLPPNTGSNCVSFVCVIVRGRKCNRRSSLTSDHFLSSAHYRGIGSSYRLRGFRRRWQQALVPIRPTTTSPGGSDSCLVSPVTN